MTEETVQTAADIQAKIESLNSLSGENLKGEMQALKRSLLANPAACMLLQPEDIGEMVKNLRRMTGIALVSATKAKAEKKPPAKKEKLSPEALQAALNSDEF